MDARIQFRVDEDTKQLAQQMAQHQGRTLSDACRELTEQLAEQQRQRLSHDAWLTEQVNEAFSRLDSGDVEFTEHQVANARLEKFKAKVRNQSK